MRLELTRRGDYAVRSMIALAAPDGPGLRSVPRIAERMAIPPRFLPQVMRDLVVAGLVESETGRTGGYRLARPAGSITLLEVVEAIEGDTRRLTCVLRGGPCGRDGYCAVHATFAGVQDAVRAQLGQVTLASVADVFASFPAGDRRAAPDVETEPVTPSGSSPRT
ncbi:MAG TPA: Rrf2 family transcriptional regulator [Candidatus Dormibacteraeota bacterium]|nr:Rrf2 family transcriptional regulator [Candidatus Dormibacteraeota bacterium]